jgi:hypothetical protein
MAKKKTPKRHAKRTTTHHATAATAKPRKKHAKRRGPVPAGMVLVRASDLGHASNPAKKKRHTRRGHHHAHHPQKHNPAPETGEHKTVDVHRGVRALAFGTVAAVAGLAGGAAIAHLGPDSKAANIAANLAGTVIGGLVGMFDQTAGTLIAHNYAVAAGQWALAPTAASRGTATNALQRSNAMARMGSGIAMPNRMMATAGSRAVNGTEDVEGVYADNMGDIDVEGVVVADNMGDPDVDGFEHISGFEPINGIMADTLGDADEMGEELDGFDDPFGDVDD